MKIIETKFNQYKKRNVKHSKHRKYIAKCLNEFRKTMSISKAAKALNMDLHNLYTVLHCSKKFNDIFYFYRKFKHVDQGIAMMWAKKIMAINYLGGECKKCGNKNVLQLCFHHTNGILEKDNSIRRLLKHTFKTIAKELNKCTLLCKNCHQELHFDKKRDLKFVLLKMANQEKCSKCGYRGNSLSSLSFHHEYKKDKMFQISNFCRHNYNKFSKPTEEIKAEVEKCKVLCFNCHSLEHINLKRFKELEKLIYHKVRFYNEKQKKYKKNQIRLNSQNKQTII